MAKERKGENKKVATDFEAMLSMNRERQRAQTMAQKFFGKDGRRKSAGAASLSNNSNNNSLGSLASRAGINKKKRASTSALPEQPKPLAARIAAPGSKKAEKIAAAIHRSKTSATAGRQANVVSGGGGGGGAPAGAPSGPRGQRGGAEGQMHIQGVGQQQQQVDTTPTNIGSSVFPTPPAPATGLSIRGLAGPYVIGAENFAPGTTAADIESAVAPIGGAVHSCKILKTRPIVAAEVMFESREGAERVVQYFNGKTADSRVLSFYRKVGGTASTLAGTGAFPQSRPRQSAPHVIDGSHGFDDPMEMDPGPSSATNQTNGSEGNASTAGGLYSDKIVPTQKRGRGFGSWGGGGGSRGRGSGAGGNGATAATRR